jgi:hypothetical protein
LSEELVTVVSKFDVPLRSYWKKLGVPLNAVINPADSVIVPSVPKSAK